MSRDLIVVMAHGKAQSIFDMNLPQWQKHYLPTLVCCPMDDPIQSKHTPVYCSLGSHAGVLGLVRCKILLWYLSRRCGIYDRFVIFEYDSFFTSFVTGSHLPRTENGLTGNLSVSVDPTFSSAVYPLPPWIIDSESLMKMHEASMATHDTITEGGFADRYWAALANRAGVKMWNYQPIGFFRGTIEKNDLEDIRRAKQLGAFAWHGVKTPEVLDAILS